MAKKPITTITFSFDEFEAFVKQINNKYVTGAKVNKHGGMVYYTQTNALAMTKAVSTLRGKTA